MIKKSLYSIMVLSTILFTSTSLHCNDDLAKVALFGKQLGGLVLNALNYEGFDTQMIEDGIESIAKQIESLSIVDIVIKKISGKPLTTLESLYLKVALDKCILTAFLIVLFFALFQLGLMLLIYIFKRLL